MISIIGQPMRGETAFVGTFHRLFIGLQLTLPVAHCVRLRRKTLNVPIEQEEH